MRPAPQGDLFTGPALPDGFVYASEFLTPGDEAGLLAFIATLPLDAARYRSFTARRRIVSFGAGYDFTANAPTPAPPLPEALGALRARAAAWADVAAHMLAQCTVAEYAPGTPLGWHRDAPAFGLVIGISLGAACRMRFRPWPHVTGTRTPSCGLTLAPRSIYLIRDHARWRWQHAISPTKTLRYSITFRTLRR